MNSKALLVTAIMVMGLFLWGCGGTSAPVTSPQEGQLFGPTVTSFAYELHSASEEEAIKYGAAENIAGKHINIGTVSVVNDDLDIIISIDTIDDWFVGETHIQIVNDPNEFPMTKNGNPKPGHFEVKDTHDPMVQTFVSHYGLADLVPGDEVFIAVHGEAFLMDGEEVIDEESSWAAGFDIPGKNWAMYFSFLVE